MKPNPLYPRIVSDYTSHLRQQGATPLSFKAFCRPYQVRYESICQWMKRHGLDVEQLRCQVLLEGYMVGPAQSAGQLEITTKKKPTGEHALTGIRIDFPDGITVNIRHASAPALVKFIDSYNQLTDKNHVGTE